MDWKEHNASMRNRLRNLNHAIVETTKDFSAMTKTVHETGVLDAKTKELVALAISVADRCDPCIGFHIEALIRAEASREEISDVLAVCIQMGGGPSLMYSAKALDAFDQLSAGR
jgi:AhpD family alkylhydroperoxidase